MVFKLIFQSISFHFLYSVLVWCYLILCFHFSYFGSLYFYLPFVLLSLYFYFLCLVAVSIISLLLVTACSEICVAKYCWSVFSHSPLLLLHLVFFLSFYCLFLSLCLFSCLLVILHLFLVSPSTLISSTGFLCLLLAHVFFDCLLFSFILLPYFTLLLYWLLIYFPCLFYMFWLRIPILSLFHPSNWISFLLCYILRHVLYYPLLIDKMGASRPNHSFYSYLLTLVYANLITSLIAPQLFINIFYCSAFHSSCHLFRSFSFLSLISLFLHFFFTLSFSISKFSAIFCSFL